jgi:hypothetical protein
MGILRRELLIPCGMLLLSLALVLVVGRFILIGAVRIIRREWYRNEPPRE